jgi:hypothetical protein
VYVEASDRSDNNSSNYKQLWTTVENGDKGNVHRLLKEGANLRSYQ